MTLDEALAIRSAVRALRPEWTADAVWDALWHPDVRRRSSREVAVAAAWIAADRDVLTPDRILAAGPWWTAAMTEPAHTPSHEATECDRHPGHRAIGCPECEDTTRPGTSADIARLRAVCPTREDRP